MQETNPHQADDQTSLYNLCLENQQRLEDCEALEAEITTLAGHINAANYRFLKLLGEFDQKHGWHGDGIKSFAHWLNWRCGISLMMAREKVRVARALGKLPKIEQAFCHGEISYSKVRAMTRAATPENEALLLQVAQYGTASHIEKLVSKYRWVQNLNRADDDQDEDDNNYDQPDSSPLQRKRLNWYQDEDGSLVFSGRLPAEEGALVVKAIEMIVDDLYQQSIENARNRDLDNARKRNLKNVSAENISEDEEDEGKADNEIGEDAAEPLPDWSEMQANGLVRLAEASLTGENLTGPGLTDIGRTNAELTDVEVTNKRPLNQSSPGPADKHHLLVHINENTAHIDYHINGGALHYLDSLDSNHFLSPEVVKRLACDAAVTTIIEDDAGHPLNVGRKTRVIPTAIKRALHVRDGGCRYPGCCQTRWTDAHHIKHWVDGGETRLDNLVTLCRYHHTRLHQGEYRIVAKGNEIHFINPSNRVITRTFYPQFAEEESHTLEQLQKTHQQLGLEIDQHTADCKWLGESMDYSMAVGSLMDIKDKH